MEKSLLANRYILLDMISEGGMGKVFKARDTLMDSQVIAIKTIKDKDRKAHLEKALLDEFYTLFSLSHPNLLKVYDIGRDIKKDELFLVTELAEGLAMDRWISGKKFDELIDVLYSILCGLSYLHRNNIIHGDLKPAHFIINQENNSRQVRIIDFGLVKHAEKSSKDKIAGSIRYIAPEIFQGRGYSKKSDIYSLGVSLFNTLYNRYPYDARTLSKYIKATTSTTPVFKKPLIKIPDNFLHILKKSIHHNPLARYPDADAMLSDICLFYGRKYQPGFSNPSVFSPFVNREKEFYLLCSGVKGLLKKAVSTPFVNIFGSQGSGKKRLIRQIKVYAKYKGIEFFSTRHEPGTDSHLSIIGMLMPYIFLYAENSGIDVSRFRAYFDIYSGRDKDIKHGGKGKAEQANNDILFSAIDLIIRLVSRGIPMVIIVEDFDRFDSMSKSFVKMLLHAVESSLLQNCVYIILSSSEKLDMLKEFKSQRYIEMENFDLDATRRMIAGILGDIPLNDAILKKIFRASEGNPLRIEKLLQSLFLNGMIHYKDGVHAVSNDAPAFIDRLPDDIGKDYYSILNMFSRNQRILCSLFALSYRPPADKDIPDLISKGSFEGGLDFIFFLRQINILKNSVDRGIRISLIGDKGFHDYLLSELSEEEKKSAHKILYDCFSEKYSDDFCLMAYHLYYSNMENSLLPGCIKKAIEQASRESIHAGRLLFFLDKAIELKDRINDRKYITSILQKKINRLYFLNDMTGIRKMEEEYLMPELKRNDPLTYISVLKSLLDIHSLDYNNPKAKEMLKLAEGISCDDADVIEVMNKIKWNRVFYFLNQNRHKEAMALCTDIFEDIKKQGDDHILSNYYGMIGELYNNKGDCQQSLYYKELSLQYAYRTGIINQIAISEHNMAVGYLNADRYDECVTYLKLAYEKFNKIHNYRLLGFALNNLSEVLANYLCEEQSAITYALNAFEINKIVGGINLINNYKILASIYRMMHKYSEALENINRGMELSENQSRLISLLESCLVKADILIDISAYSQAVKIIEKAVKISKESLGCYYLRDFLARDSQISIECGNHKRLSKSISQLEKYINVEEAVIFMAYFYQSRQSEELLKAYDFIAKCLSDTDIPRARYNLHKAGLYLFSMTGQAKKLSRHIALFYEFLRNDYNAGWKDYRMLEGFLPYAQGSGLPDIKKKAEESYEFTKQYIPRQYLSSFLRDKQNREK